MPSDPPVRTPHAPHGGQAPGDAADATGPGASWQERFEDSRLGRRIITAFLALTIAGVLVWLLPASALRETLQPIVAPFVTTVGLEQGWRLFAPNPRRTSREVYARIEFDDGSQTTWTLPGGDLIGSYRSYRWRKWAEELRSDAREELWEPAARYLARLHTSEGRAPTTVTLVRRWAEVPELRSGAAPEWHEYEFYTLELSGSATREPDGG